LGPGTVKITGLPGARGRQKVKISGKDYESVDCTVVLRLSGLIGTASHPDMQKIRKIGFFFENRLHWQFEVENNFYFTAVLGCVFISVQLKH
jgi:hypothetical protein